MLEQVSASFSDPQGSLFEDQSYYVRKIHTDVDFYEDILKNSVVVKNLIQKKFLVDTQFNQNYQGLNQVLLHEKITPINYCSEWSFSMLKDAALRTLHIGHELLDEGMEIQDCHSWNIVFNGTNPVLVDFTSIVKSNPKYLFYPFVQFQSFFLRPLLLKEMEQHEIVTHSLKDFIGGLNLDTFNRYYPSTKGFFKHPFVVMGTKFELMVQRYLDSRHELKRKLIQKISNPTHKFSNEQKKSFIKKQISQIESLKTPNLSVWTDYYKNQDQEEHVSYQAKISQIEKILTRTKFESGLDIGCNTGRFSYLLAKYAKKVIAIDSSQDCIETVYDKAKKDFPNITPMVVDFSKPTAALGINEDTFTAFHSRVSADVVLFLGVMHHIHIKERQPFAQIIKSLARLTKQTLIYEFVAEDDINNLLISGGRPVHYSEESILNELKNYFSVEILPSDRTTRKMFICTKL
jgi:2-polyprenyl-3-methyl-5-hydroxy-6-metoxy-1,4-benzoquinol methylase